MADSSKLPEAVSTPSEQTSEPRRPSPERRFIQRQVVQPLIQWMPLGGSGWLFASFLLKQEWTQVLLTFPITIVTAVWAAYSKNFVERLSEIYAEKGKQDADTFNKWLASLDETIKWQFSSFEAKYLKCQRLDCQEDNPDGMKHEDDIFTPLLQEVYVPLRLSSDSVLPGYGLRLQNAEAEACRSILIWDLLKQVRQNSAYRQIAIRAWGGYGKTTLLKHITYTYGAQAYRNHHAPKLVPFLLYLTRCWQELKNLPKDDPASLSKLLTDYHLQRLPQAEDLQVPPNWARNLLKWGNALVMFDGFDEVPPAERQAVSEWLSQQMRHYRESVFIITSRPTAYTNDYTAQRLTASFWIEDFDDIQRQRFVEQWYHCQERYARGGRDTPDVVKRAKQSAASLLAQLESRPELKAISGNALLLNMMARFHRDKQGAELPQRKVELYQDICELQLNRRPRAKGITLLLSSLSHRQEVLQIVALAMMQRAKVDEQGFKQIQRDDLLALMAPALAERDPDVPAQTFLDQIVQVSELLVEKEGSVYEFAHLSFQEFLAASEVVRLRQELILYEFLGLDAWKPTILFYTEMVNPTRVIQEAINLNFSTLAHQIWLKKLKQPGLSSAIRQELNSQGKFVIGARVYQLEEYLKNGQWKEADQETYRLMITTVGKEEGQLFESQEVLNFPCEELLAIDRLWVKYSNSKFGFSVQKDIYLECGGIPDGQYHGEAFEKFGDRVGWRQNRTWRMNVIYDTSSPRGHLPYDVIVVIGCRHWVGEKGLVFSRIAHCEL